MSCIFVTQRKQKSKLTTKQKWYEKWKDSVTKVRVNESRKEYNGENIRLESNFDKPILVIIYLISWNTNKTVKRFLKCFP